MLTRDQCRKHVVRGARKDQERERVALAILWRIDVESQSVTFCNIAARQFDTAVAVNQSRRSRWTREVYAMF
jgi:hypothetical protein